MSAIIAYRLAQRQPVSFSIAMNDYGFELLGNEEVDIESALQNGLFNLEYLIADIYNSVNSTEMAKRRFREIAQIAGLLFTGYPGKVKKSRHLTSSAGLLFDVFKQYDPENLLLRQAYNEVLHYQLDETRLEEAFIRINNQNIIVKKPENFTPFSFPLVVDTMREKLTSENLEDRIRKLKLELE